eukprot:4379035-Amphidinium_carterae.1
MVKRNCTSPVTMFSSVKIKCFVMIIPLPLFQGKATKRRQSTEREREKTELRSVRGSLKWLVGQKTMCATVADRLQANKLLSSVKKTNSWSLPLRRVDLLDGILLVFADS